MTTPASRALTRLRPAKALKFKNQPVQDEDGFFASKREHRRWQELKLLQRAGYISELQRQVPFPLKVNDVLICKYIADFTYKQRGRFIVEDAKGVRTDAFKLKARLFGALHGFDITEV